MPEAATTDIDSFSARLPPQGALVGLGLMARHREFVAVAYSNRAVLSILAQDLPAGQSDLMLARKASKGSSFVKRNLEASRIVQEARLERRSLPAG